MYVALQWLLHWKALVNSIFEHVQVVTRMAGVDPGFLKRVSRQWLSINYIIYIHIINLNKMHCNLLKAIDT